MRIFAGVLLLVLSGCASTPQVTTIEEPGLRESPRESVRESVDLLMALPDERPRLNVSIQVFTSDRQAGNSLYDSAHQLRSVESRFIPYQLKRTLDQSGYWGAVRVMPVEDLNAEVYVTGRILASDGTRLKLHVSVRDATGRTWLENEYLDWADDLDYATDPQYTRDPFVDLYHTIANEMAAFYTALDEAALTRVLDTALIRYAEAVAPEVFSRYLERNGGELILAGLPARDDPVLLGVMRIRDSEYLFADGVDAHYESLYRQIGPTYAWWRHYGYELITGNQRLENVDASRGASRGSWYALERIYRTYKESKMNEDALRELTNSFDRETTPTVTEIRGRVVALGGTLEEQYGEWRRILRELYREETGL